MIFGIDVSHWNSINDIGDRYKNSDFIIAKCTEGVSFKDPLFRTHIENALLYGNEVGFYHFARPERNRDPRREADFYLSILAKYGYIGKGIMALDWEGSSLSYPISWARKWLDYCFQQTGIRPLFYCQRSYTNRIQAIREGNYGLWIARYPKDPGKTGPEPLDGKGCAMWQYSSRPIDQDRFYGSVEQFKKYYERS